MTNVPEEIVRVHRTRQAANFTVLPNELIYDSDLDPFALGVLIRMLGNAPKWRATADGMWRAAEKKNVRGQGRDAYRAAFQRLIQAGYVTRKRAQGEDGLWWTDVHVYDAPQPVPEENTTSSLVAPMTAHQAPVHQAPVHQASIQVRTTREPSLRSGSLDVEQERSTRNPPPPPVVTEPQESWQAARKEEQRRWEEAISKPNHLEIVKKHGYTEAQAHEFVQHLYQNGAKWPDRIIAKEDKEGTLADRLAAFFKKDIPDYMQMRRPRRQADFDMTPPWEGQPDDPGDGPCHCGWSLGKQCYGQWFRTRKHLAYMGKPEQIAVLKDIADAERSMSW